MCIWGTYIQQELALREIRQHNYSLDSKLAHPFAYIHTPRLLFMIKKNSSYYTIIICSGTVHKKWIFHESLLLLRHECQTWWKVLNQKSISTVNAMGVLAYIAPAISFSVTLAKRPSSQEAHKKFFPLWRYYQFFFRSENMWLSTLNCTPCCHVYPSMQATWKPLCHDQCKHILGIKASAFAYLCFHSLINSCTQNWLST